MPRLRAAGPNQVWSWDITYLPTTVRGIWLYLYLVIDVWSRKVVAWDVAEREDPAIAAALVSRACLRERISKGRAKPLILHADNGNAMRAATLESRLEELGVLRSFSRPRVSNDNPYSEAQFKTLKYRPDFPDRFGCIEDARAFCGPFFDWYNQEHHHAGLALLTPADVHFGRVAERLVQSQSTAAILTTFNEVNMQPVMDLRKKYGERFEKEHGTRLGFMSFFIKAAVYALKKYPVVNASVDGNDIVYHGYFDIGIAVGSLRAVPCYRDTNLRV